LGPYCYPLAMEMMVKGQVPVEDIVTHQFSLEQFQQAFQLALKPVDSIKVMFEP
ncbi:MAG: erythritol/L-threitol dehydrogenase, partial [Planctomycetes bacterium]|nr:erythritol/L-threitol dehydrogenase [Planctomycetota bacterium]